MTTREIIISVVGFIIIFALALVIKGDYGLINSSDRVIKEIKTDNDRLIQQEIILKERIKQDSLILVDLKTKRDHIRTKRDERKKKFDDTVVVIESTDSITDLVVGADIIRESHKERLSYR